MEGVNDGLAAGERPRSLSALHKYNLYNQGWDQPPVPTGRDHMYTPLFQWHDILKAYPSNGDVWWTGKGVNKDGQEALTEKAILLISKSTGFAPKGHYIFNAFDVNRSATSGVKGVPSKTSEGFRPSVCAFFAGRVFYAGVPHPDYQGKVYYTQIVEGNNNIGSCYQVNDPTSEQLSDLLATDGGEIKITGMGRVAFMVEVGNSLILFANNGIWAIGGSGAEGTGFSATDFSIKKIGNIGTEASSSFVDVEGTPVWWNFDGIWTLGEGGVVSLTNNTIKSFIQNEIPGINRRYIQGAYNPLKQTIQWLWKSEVPDSIADGYRYDRILEFNVETKAFYPFSWNIADQAFSTVFCASDITVTSLTEETVTNSDGSAVTDSTTALVTSSVIENINYTSSEFKYYTTNL